MKISVQLFAAAKDAVGQSPLEVTVSDEARVSDLRAAMIEMAAELKSISGMLLFAVNNQFANDDTQLQHDDEVACFPPVSGG